MPSDDSVRSEQGSEQDAVARVLARVLEPLRDREAAFRAAVARAQTEVRRYLAAHVPRPVDRVREAVLELGPFAAGRIDGARFAALSGAPAVLAPRVEAIVRHCADVLDELLAEDRGLFTCEVPSGGDTRREVEEALAEIGRAFGAALVFQAARTGAYRPEQHDGLLRAFPFRRWNAAERRLAPPLVVTVDGADLQPAALADYLDGTQLLVLVVRGRCTPAPLARVLTPGVLAVQGSDPALLTRLAAATGPAIALLTDAPIAHFVHDPAAPDGRWLDVSHWPDEPRATLGRWSVWQQREELALLQRLADAARPEIPASAVTPPVVTPATGTIDTAVVARNNAPDVTPSVDALARWLLAEARL